MYNFFLILKPPIPSNLGRTVLRVHFYRQLVLQLNVVTSKLQMRETENLNLKKEADQFKRELKITAANYSAAEAKINKLTEDLEKMKASVKATKQEEKVWYNICKLDSIKGTC